MSLEFKKASLEIKDYIQDFVGEFIENEEEVVPMSVKMAYYNYDKWLIETANFEKRETCPPNLVPSHTYFLFNGPDRIIGAINIRHYLNENLLKHGGHIGYGVRPSERKKGYATLMLKMALPIAKELGIEKALITCDKNNIASANVIKNNGGVLENEIMINGKITQRYWIEL